MSGRLDLDGTDWGDDDPEFGEAGDVPVPPADHRTGPPPPVPTRSAAAAHHFAELRETLRQAAERSDAR